MPAEIATLAIRVTSDSAAKATADLKGLEAQGAKTEAVLGSLKRGAAALGLTFGAAWLGHKFIEETSEAQRVTAQLEAVLRSTKGAAGQSLAALHDYATALQRTTAYSHEAVGSAQALLLTFTQVKGETFPRATRAILDMAQAMGGDLQGKVIQVGKALNDPIIGITALQKVGVSFTESQKKVIKSLAESGQMAQAQALILKELETEFGGSAQAARDTLGGALAGLKNSFDNLFQASREDSSGIIAALNGITDVLPGIGSTFGQFVGGIELLYVDAVAHIQRGNAAIYEDTAKLLSITAGALSLAGFTKDAGALLAKAAELDEKGRTLAAAFRAWHDEAYAAAAGTAALTTSTGKLKTSAGELTGVYTLLHEETVKKLADIQREIAYTATHREEVLALMRAEKQRAEQMAILGDQADPLYRLNHAIATGHGPYQIPKVQPLGGSPGLPDNSGLNFPLLDDLEIRSAEHVAAIKKQIGRELTAAEAANVLRAAIEEEKIRDNFLRQWQQTFANGVSDMLTNGLASWRRFFASLKDLGVRTIGDIFSRRIMEGRVNGILSAMGTQVGSAKSSGAFGLSANALGGIAGIALAVGGMVSSLQAQTAAAKRAQVEFEANSRAWAVSLRDFATQFRVDPLQKALDDQQKALATLAEQARQNLAKVGVGIHGDTSSLTGVEGIIAQIDKLQKFSATANPDLAKFREQLLGLADAYRRNVETVRQLREAEDQRYASDLHARQLRAAGMNAEADALDLWNRQVKEFADAVKQGFSPALLAELSRTQNYERQALAAKQAADAQNALAAAQQAAAAAAQQMADTVSAAWAQAATFAAKMATATEDLGVRLLRAQGQVAAADRMAFELQQKRELAQVAADIRAANVARYQQEVAIQATALMDPQGAASAIMQVRAAFQQQVDEANAYKAQLVTVQAAESTAFLAQQSQAGATATATQGGSFNTIVSRTTAIQGDRLVDEATTTRTYIVMYLPYLPYLETIARKLGGGVNALMGGQLAGTQALAGSSLVA